MEAAIDGTVNDASLFLVAAGERTAEAYHDGGEQVLKAFREFRVEGEPALHQRFPIDWRWFLVMHAPC